MINEIKAGDTVKVNQILREVNSKGEIKERIQVFEGLVLARKHGKEAGATITVRRVVDGIGVEKIFPLDSPLIKSIELVKRSKIRRAKLYFLRSATGKRARLKTVGFFSNEEQPEKWKDIPTIEVNKEMVDENLASPSEEIVAEELLNERPTEEEENNEDKG